MERKVTGWMIVRESSAYGDPWHTRRAAIDNFEETTCLNWDDAKKNGYRAAKVTITWQEKGKKVKA